jgi:hypothetical protein
MINFRYYSLKNKIIQETTKESWSNDFCSRIILQSRIGNVSISTIFLGISYRNDGTKLFEHLAWTCSEDEDITYSDTYDQAINFHFDFLKKNCSPIAYAWGRFLFEVRTYLTGGIS